MINAANYLRGIQDILNQCASTNLPPLDDDEPYDLALDAPYSVVES